jgi:hypothetical protein
MGAGGYTLTAEKLDLRVDCLRSNLGLLLQVRRLTDTTTHCHSSTSIFEPVGVR